MKNLTTRNGRSAMAGSRLRTGALLVAVVALGGTLAACSSSGTTSESSRAAASNAPAPASEGASSAAPEPAAPASLEGKTVCVASPIEVEILKEFWDTMRNQAAEPGNGEAITVVDANGDSAKQHTQFDAFVAQGCNVIVPLVLTADGWEEQVANAVSKGIGVFNHSASAIGGMTQNVGLGQYEGGYGVGEEAARWINENMGGTAEVGVLAILNDPQLQLRGQGFKDALAKDAPGATVVGEVNAQTKDEGAAGAANLLQAHPGISVLYAAGDDPGLGALAAATEAGKTDPKAFFLGSTDGTAASFEKIGEGGIYQSSWSFNFPFSATQLQRDIETFLRGGTVQPTRIQSGTLVTTENLADVQAMLSNPQAPEVQDLYADYMKYSDVPLGTNQPFLDAFK